MGKMRLLGAWSRAALAAGLAALLPSCADTPPTLTGPDTPVVRASATADDAARTRSIDFDALPAGTNLFFNVGDVSFIGFGIFSRTWLGDRPRSGSTMLYPSISSSSELHFRKRVSRVSIHAIGHHHTWFACYGRGRWTVHEYFRTQDETHKWMKIEVEAPGITYCRLGYNSFYDDLEFTLEPEDPPLSLTCTPEPVTRGEEVTCTVARSPADAAGDLRITRWSFNEKPRADGDVTSPEWKGVMVHGGTVKVEGSVDGKAFEPLLASITVAERDWSKKAPGFVEKEVPNGTDARMRPVLPVLPRWMHDFGHANFFDAESTTSLLPDPTTQVRGGPNDGLYYFADLPLTIYGLYVLNRAALSPGSDFARLQEQDRSSGSSGLGAQWCTRSAVPGMLAGVEAHERKHVEVYRETYTRAFAPLAQRLERMSEEDASVLEEAFDGLHRASDPPARAASRAIHSRTDPPYVFMPRQGGRPCKLRNASGNEMTNQPGV